MFHADQGKRTKKQKTAFLLYILYMNFVRHNICSEARRLSYVISLQGKCQDRMSLTEKGVEESLLIYD